MSKENDLSLNELTEQFETLVAWFEQDEFDLEQALDKYKQAHELAGKIKQQLDEIENKITVLQQSFDA